MKRLKSLVQDERSLTAKVIEHLAECRRRDLHRKEGYPSLFQYCIRVLHLSEHAAYDRIFAANCALEFPNILERLADGSVNLTTIRLLGPHLTKKNHDELLGRAGHKSKLEVMEIVASLHPQPPVPSSIRKLPEPTVSAGSSQPTLALPNSGVTVAAPSALVGVHQGREPDRPDARCAARALRKPVIPLAPKLYKVEFTAGAETHQKLRQLQDLLRHQVPSGDLAVIIDMALSDLLEKVMKQKFGSCKSSCKKRAEPELTRALEWSEPSSNSSSFQNELEVSEEPGSKNRLVETSKELEEASLETSKSRYIPKQVRKEVWNRDGGQCAFRSHHGQRCPSRAWLEFHHVDPYAWGGEATVKNIELRCRAHNAFEGTLLFGSHRRVQRE